MIYLKLAEKLLEGKEKGLAYAETRQDILEFWDAMECSLSESAHFEKVVQNDIRETTVDD
jgi:hypothetical protein